MTSTPAAMTSATRKPSPELSALLHGLKPGQRIRLTQTVRVGRHIWTTTVDGVFRAIGYLATGLATHRATDEEVVVAMVHFTKDNGELSSITLDENSKVEVIS